MLLNRFNNPELKELSSDALFMQQIYAAAQTDHPNELLS